MAKDAGFRIRVEASLRREFVQTCRTEDKPAAQVIREFMREYIERRRVPEQRELFGPEPSQG